MNRNHLRTVFVSVIALALFAASAGTAIGQGELIGQRGGLTTPTAPSTGTTTTPTLPPSLHLPDNVESSLLKGLNSSGTALRPGMGWLVSDLTHQGIHGRELTDVIHQLKPYKQRGVLTFPQVTQQGSSTHGGLTRPPLNGGTFSNGSFSGGGGGSFGKGFGKKK